MENLSLNLLAPHLWFWLLLLVPALCLAFWTYYRLLAPLNRPTRLALWVLRGVAFFLVLFALWQPVLTYVRPDRGKPGLAVLIDRSASISLPGASGAEARGREIEALRPELSEQLKRSYRVQWFGFNEALRAVRPDSLPAPNGATGLGTALEGALLRASSNPVSGIVVVSDGVNTLGRDPVRVAGSSSVPVFTLAVGPRQAPRDLELRRVETNPTAWKGEPLPLSIGLSTTGLAGRTATIEVRENGELRETRAVAILGGQGLEQELKLSLAPREPGMRLFEVTAKVDGDSIAANNRRLVAVSVLEKKTKVLCVADALDWDLAFLRRSLEVDTTLAYTYLIQDRPGSYRADGDRAISRLPGSAGELSPFAAVVLIWTGRGFADGFLDRLGPFVREGGGLLVLGGPRTLAGLPAGFVSALPASIEADPARDRASALQLTGEGMRHPALQLRDNPAEAAQWIAGLPPLWRNGGRLAARGPAQVLFDWNLRSGRSPACVAGFVGRGKSIWWNARGLWRWRLLAAGVNLPTDAPQAILTGVTRWLAEPLSRDRFQARPTRQVYQSGEEITWNASLWDEAYAPVKGARIRVEVTPAGEGSSGEEVPERRNVDLIDAIDPGHYDAAIGALPPGEYRYRATADAAEGSRSFGATEGRFWVEEMGPEFARPWSDRETLAEIARRSGGASFDAGGLSQMLSQIPRALRRVGQTREVELWNHWILFLLFVAVLSTEWFLRRRRGLA